jgi:UDP-N-acetylmuramoyl-tripeptide--D-alanyl-D-alanine ligase
MRAALRSLLRPLVRQYYLPLLYALAYVWRRLLFRTTFIAITGSVGKTTTKECLAAILEAHFPTVKTRLNNNDRRGVPRSILAVRPWHRYAVLEVATDEAGLMRRHGRLVRPDVAVVLAVARTHTAAFPSIEHTAAEKREIILSLRPGGVAILNAEDPRVLAMASHAPCRVKTFGRAVGLDLWAEDVSSRWPSRLSLTAHAGSEAQRIETSLVGVHWVNSILAAVLTAQQCGVSLSDAARALASVPPFPGRMQPVRLPGGAVVLRDEYNSSPPTLEAALRAFESFEAKRRVLVISGFSDSPKNSRSRMKELGTIAARVAALAVFVNREHGRHAVKAAIAAGMAPDRALAFSELQDAARYLAATLEDGDLVLVKGRTTDHLSRLIYAQFGPIGCWKLRCRKTITCDFCEELRPSSRLPELAAGAGGTPVAPRLST